jgi:BirA family biotin operon repressor/biotin-[acetyl-CoA-carboxylase] ligase
MKLLSPPVKLSTVTSTNDYAARLIKDKRALQGMVISADHQTHGRGQENNRWESQSGKNLTISIIFQPNMLLASRQFVLNKITSLAIRDFLLEAPGNENISIKWPNDVYIGDRKAAGVLISNIIEGNLISWSVIGIGVNINQTRFNDAGPNPVSLRQISGLDYDLDECLKILCHSMERRLQQLIDKKYEEIDLEYFKVLYRSGLLAQFLYKGQRIEAKIKGIGEFGHLQLETAEGEFLHCDLKEIIFL